MEKQTCQGIAARLKEARIAARLTQGAAAKELGVSRQAVSAWECATAQPTCAQWYRIGLVYGVSLDYLVYGARETAADALARIMTPDQSQAVL